MPFFKRKIAVECCFHNEAENVDASLLQVQPVVLLWASLQVLVVQFSLLLESVVEQVAEAHLLVVQRV